MKHLAKISPLAAPLAAIFSVLVCVANLRASGPGGAGNVSGGGAVTTGGGSSAGGSISGGSRGGAAVASGGGHSSAVQPGAGTRMPSAVPSNGPRTASTGAFSRGSSSVTNSPANYPQTANRSGFSSAMGLQNRFASRPANAWSGTNDSANRRNPAPGQRLDPGAYGANLPTNHSSGNGSSNHRYRLPNRYYNYPYVVGPYYAPYLGYYGGDDGAYPYGADGTLSDVNNGYDNVTPTVTAQPTSQGQDVVTNQPNPTPQPRSQNNGGNTDAPSMVPNNGPDSLVEAVQQELIRRGYFSGKVDAMYGPDTKEALRKFQQDHHLADSGLINEATLHALELD